MGALLSAGRPFFTLRAMLMPYFSILPIHGLRLLACIPFVVLTLMVGISIAGCASRTAIHTPASKPHAVESVTSLTPPRLPWARTTAAPPPASRFPKTENYSFKLKKVPALSVLEALSDTEPFSFEGDECALQPINLYLKEVSALQAIEYIAETANLRVQFDGQHIRLGCNTPYWVTYKLDYPAIERNTNDVVNVSSNPGGHMGHPGQVVGGLMQGGAGIGGSINNAPNVSIQTKHQNRFWDEISRTIEYMLTEPDSKDLPSPVTTETTVTQQSEGSTLNTDANGRVRQRDIKNATVVAPFSSESTINRRSTSSAERPLTRVLAHPESGLLLIRATQKQHVQVAELLERVTQRALKQVLIEATVAEVRLSSDYQKGIQWQLLSKTGNGLNIELNPLTANNPANPIPGLLTLRFKEAAVAGLLGINAALSLLEQYGEVTVISSPKLAVLNQQTAIMKVVDNRVYFTIQVQTTAPTTISGAYSTFSTQVHSVPVGFFMTVIPQIDDDTGITLTIRPTISRIVGFVNDPNPALAQVGVTSQIPEIQTREIESVMRLQNGEIALLGGLMQNTSDQLRSTIPGIGGSGLANALLTQERSQQQRSELVILLQPVIQPLTKNAAPFNGWYQP